MWVAAGTPGTHVIIHHVFSSPALPESVPLLFFPSMEASGAKAADAPCYFWGIPEGSAGWPCAPQKQAHGWEWGLAGRGLGPLSSQADLPPSSPGPSQPPGTPSSQCPRFLLHLSSAARWSLLVTHNPGSPSTVHCGCGIREHVHPSEAARDLQCLLPISQMGEPSPSRRGKGPFPRARLQTSAWAHDSQLHGVEALSPTFQKWADASHSPSLNRVVSACATIPGLGAPSDSHGKSCSHAASTHGMPAHPARHCREGCRHHWPIRTS